MATLAQAALRGVNFRTQSLKSYKPNPEATRVGKAVSTGFDMNRYWWLEALPVGWTWEEGRAGMALYFAVLVVFVAFAVPIVKLAKMFGMPTELGIFLLGLSLFPAFLLARPIMAFVRPDVLKAGDEANAKRMAARKNVD